MSIMVVAELRTRDGHVVVRVHVPPFDPPADVLIWGDALGNRHFMLDATITPPKGIAHVYREAHAYWALPTHLAP